MSDQLTPEEHIVHFDLRLYSVMAVKKAVYRYLDRFAADFELTDREIICRIRFSQSPSEERARRAIDELKKEALDQDLREKIKVETEGVRNLILAHAFSKTGIGGDEQVSKD